ncbi:MAG: hypothetical protein FWF03_05475 [Defluviitaleaceae bacterium]|nr:hypothetical protein [Defluviitaleaceae bacterium]
MKNLLGAYHPFIEKIFETKNYPMSFLDESHRDADEWRNAARGLIRNLLSAEMPETPLDLKTHDEYEKDGLTYRHVSYAMPYGPRAEAIHLRPAGESGRLPGVLALHDHGGFKYYGKEKLTSPKDCPEAMREFKLKCYEGRSWASELALRGYEVFVPDVFLWGSRRIMTEDVPDWYAAHEDLREPAGSQKHIEAYNRFAGEKESDIAKAFNEAGVTWPGLMLYDDTRALDCFLKSAGVDAGRIGCGGLSGGGLRTVYLAGMDERVKASVCVGFMSTSAEIAMHKVHCHTWMYYLPGLGSLMDFTDVYALRGRKPTMVMFDTEDPLFTTKGQEDADRRLRAIYAKMGAPELYEGRFYPGPHKFDIEMQTDAFNFFDKYLK